MSAPAAPIRVLMIDDDPMQLELVDRALARDGFEVRAVTTVDELVREAARFAPHLVLIDVNMPDAPSDETIAAARAAAPTARLVLYSAWEDSKLRALAERLGVHGFISKSESVFGIAKRLRALQA